MEIHQLPAVNAVLNALSGTWLALGFVFVRRKRITAHRFCMSAAVATSCLFLTSYLIYHFQTGSTSFQSRGWIRPVYFTVLVSHTILAAAILPMVAVTLYRAVRGHYARHRRLARWTWPVWMYVSVTGVVIYLLLYQVDPRLSGDGASGDHDAVRIAAPADVLES